MAEAETGRRAVVAAEDEAGRPAVVAVEDKTGLQEVVVAIQIVAGGPTTPHQYIGGAAAPVLTVGA